MKKFGFTLAEVLITLAIIGVIAAITLPSLMDNANYRALEKQTAKFYSTLQNVTGMIQAEYQVDDLSDINLTPELIASKLKVAEQCSIKDCAPKKYGFLDRSLEKKSPSLLFMGAGGYGYTENDQEVDDQGNENLYLLEDGTAVYIERRVNMTRIEDKNNKVTKRQPLTLYVDVNGKKAPNVLGRDLWIVSISNDGKLVDPEVTTITEKKDAQGDVVKSETNNLLTKDNCNLNYSGSCFNYFRKNGFKFDY